MAHIEIDFTIVNARMHTIFSIDDLTMQRMTDQAARPAAPVSVLDPGLLATLLTALQQVMDHDKGLNDPIGDGSGRNALPPDGDDYNALCGILQPIYDALGMIGPLSPWEQRNPKEGVRNKGEG